MKHLKLFNEGLSYSDIKSANQEFRRDPSTWMKKFEDTTYASAFLESDYDGLLKTLSLYGLKSNNWRPENLLEYLKNGGCIFLISKSGTVDYDYMLSLSGSGNVFAEEFESQKLYTSRDMNAFLDKAGISISELSEMLNEALDRKKDSIIDQITTAQQKTRKTVSSLSEIFGKGKGFY